MGSKDEYDYGVVLDAGSSGTRSYVYKWRKSDLAQQSGTVLRALPVVETKKKYTKKIHPGVSSFSEKPERIGPDHLKGLLEHAAKHIPAEALSETPIFLLATAGMRLLPEHQRNTLLNNICSYIKMETQFSIRDCDSQIQVISGETEGLYGWIAANYLMGGFDASGGHDHGKGHHTYGFLDMGGASAQIAFAPNSTEAEKHANDLKLVRLRTIDGATQEHRVFVTTWLGFGVNEARKRYLKTLLEASSSSKLLDPCLPSGYLTTLDPHEVLPDKVAAPERAVVGTGLFKECLKRTYPLLEKNAPCLDEPCLINGQHVPAIDFDVNHFIGISEYWHTTHEALQLAGEDDKVFDFKTYQTRVKQFCERPWSETQAAIKGEMYKHLDEQTAYELCFKSSWLINMLYDGIGIPRVGIEEAPSKHTNATKQIIDSSKAKGYLDPFQAVDKIKQTEVSWTMGKIALYASSQIKPTGFEATDFNPVGFGSNIPGTAIPSDFEYPGGSQLPSPADDNSYSSPKGPQSLTDKLSVPFLKSDSIHRTPGLVLFLLIVIIALFYLCGRDRRTRFFTKYLPIPQSIATPHPLNTNRTPKKPHSPNSRTKFTDLLSRLPIPFLQHHRSSSLDNARAMEEGATTRLFDPADFELGDMLNDSDTDSIILGNGGNNHSAGSGYASPTHHRSRTPRPNVGHSSKSHDGSGGWTKAQAQAGRLNLKPDVLGLDRRGVVVRTESRERLHGAGAGAGAALGLGLGVAGAVGAGRKSRSGSVSPTRGFKPD